MLPILRRACAALVAAACLLPAGASAAIGDLLPAAIRTLEADGSLDEARRQLEAMASTLDPKDVEAHRALLDRTRNLFVTADLLARHDLLTQARDTLTPIIQELQNPRDAALAVAVHRKIAALNAQLALAQRNLAVERDAMTALARADTMLERGQYAQAGQTYGEVAKMQGIPVATRTRAERGVAAAAQRQFEAEPFGLVATSVHTLRTGARTVSGWGLVGIGLLPLVGLAWVARRLALTNVRTLELTDLTLPAPSPTANRELAQRFEEVLERIRLAGRGTTTLEAAGTGGPQTADDDDLLPPDLLFVNPSVDVPELVTEFEKFVATTPAVQLGGFGFNPQQLWALLKKLFTRRARYAFTGDLTTYDGCLILTLRSVDRRTGKTTEWRASSPTSDAARLTCLVDVATRLLLASPSAAAVTADCESLKAYVLGLDQLGRPETADTLKAAADYLQAAVDRDPHNWPARFHLALVLRKRKQIRAALQHLDWFGSPDAAANPSLSKHIASNPDFPHIIAYHRASTLAVGGRRADQAEIDRTFAALMELEGAQDGIDADRRLRLAMLARSAASTRDGMRVASAPRGSKRQEVLAPIRDRLAEHVEWFDRKAPDLDRIGSGAHALARGVVLHAWGRIQYAMGDRHAAATLEEVIERLPDYADAYVDLAQVLLRAKAGTSWAQRVSDLLDRALAIDANHAKAKFIYARFYISDAARNLSKAEEYLTSAPFDPVSLFMLAQLLNAGGKHAEALDALQRAIALQPDGPVFRIRLYAESLQALVRQNPRPPGLDDALRRLCQYDTRIKRRDKSSKNYERIAALYREISSDLAQQGDSRCFAVPIEQ